MSYISNMTEEKTKSLTMQCKTFFGLLSDQRLQDFVAELKELTDQDKEDLIRYFNEAGMPTVLKK